jgi:hypothetical protein
MGLPKKLRLELNDAVREIEELDPYCEDPKNFNERMRRTIAVLYSKAKKYEIEISPESDYRKRLRVVEERARQAFEEKKRDDEEWNKPPQEKKKNQIQIYSGLLKKIKIKACIDMEKYSLKRFPDKNKDVSFRWRFNANGRLENLDLTTRFGSERIVSIKDVKTNRTADIEYYPFPEKALPFVTGFKNNPKPIFYEILIRLGYYNINDLLNNLNSGIVENSTFSDGETLLVKIINNGHAMQMIKETASVFPYVDVTSSGKWIMSYKPYRKK